MRFDVVFHPAWKQYEKAGARREVNIGVTIGHPSFDGTVKHTRARIAERVRDAVFTMVMAGRADISMQPLRAGHEHEQRPVAWKLARMEAAAGQPWLTSLRHTGVPALPVLRVLLPCLDGTRDRAALRSALIDALQSGSLPMPEPPAGQGAASLEMIADGCLEQTLSYLRYHALLASERPASG